MTTLKYFKGIGNLQDLKQAYRKLAFELHPDRGGVTAIFQEMGNEYDALFEKLKNTFINADGETYTKENTEAVETFKDIIDRLVNFDGITVTVIGSWLWVEGDTKPFKDELKKMNFRFSAKKVAWYFKEGTYRKRSKNKYTMHDLKTMYDSEEVSREGRNKRLAV